MPVSSSAEVLDPCPVCEKHQGRGPLASPPAWATEHVVVSHRGADADGLGVLGYLFVEPRRHVPSWDLMDAGEVAAVAEAAWLAARCLRRLLAPEGVFTAIVGRRIAHVHQHVFVRHAGTPEEIGWFGSSSWPGAPRVPGRELEAFAHRVGDEAGVG